MGIFSRQNFWRFPRCNRGEFTAVPRTGEQGMWPGFIWRLAYLMGKYTKSGEIFKEATES